MGESRWDRWSRGIDCPFDRPRPASNDHWDFIASLSVSSLYLTGNQTYRGQCLLIWDIRHSRRLDELSPEEWALFCNDLYAAEKAITRALNPDHMNVAILGNVVPHLHWQIVPRYRTDPRWEAPVWTTSAAEMSVTRLPAAERAELIETLRNALG